MQVYTISHARMDRCCSGCRVGGIHRRFWNAPTGRSRTVTWSTTLRHRWLAIGPLSSFKCWWYWAAAAPPACYSAHWWLSKRTYQPHLRRLGWGIRCDQSTSWHIWSQSCSGILWSFLVWHLSEYDCLVNLHKFASARANRNTQPYITNNIYYYQISTNINKKHQNILK